MIQTLNELFPKQIPKPADEMNDQKFKEFKIYRLYHLNASIRTSLDKHLKSLFIEFRNILSDFILHEPVTFPRLVRDTGLEINQSIESAIGFSKASELSFIWTLWKNRICEFNQILEELLNQMGPMRLLHGENEAPLTPPAVKLGTSLIPVFKLSRLFFNKLSRERVMKEEVGMSTEMSSGQWSSLDQSIEDILDSVFFLKSLIGDADGVNPVYTSSAIIEELKHLTGLFHSLRSLINLHILPNLFPNSLDLSSRVYFEDWFDSWTTSLSNATHNAIQAAKSFQSSATPSS
ncbi:hypothetical protein PGT21_017072 [Puccinia graminis f. sp. tritici]|uniref:Uncharacterized protein n=1 Tax=Puccinia graminis f. sp. tritici TaxID=56615 RepID=A0A5B0MC65_PUCGR|nr:hypothetical protein PGT21_017072 [Puccinia graminis f. sp. tritici]